MNKKLLIALLLVIFVGIVGYVIFNQQKINNIVNTEITTITTTVLPPITTTIITTTTVPPPTTTIQSAINKADRIPLCSNQYYETEYYINDYDYDEEGDIDGRIVIKDFPYRKIKKGEHCNEFEIMATLPIHLQGVIMSEEAFEDFENDQHICYLKNLSLEKINDLFCVQKIELSGMYSVGDFSDSIENCFFENDDLQNLSNMINLEHITFHSCSIKNINSDWGKKMTKLKSIKIRFDIYCKDCEGVEKILNELPLIKTVDTLDIDADYMSTFPLSPNYYKAICNGAKLSDKDLFVFINGYKIFIKENKFRLESYNESFPKSVFNKWMTCEEGIKFDRDGTHAESGE